MYFRINCFTQIKFCVTPSKLTSIINQSNVNQDIKIKTMYESEQLCTYVYLGVRPVSLRGRCVSCYMLRSSVDIPVGSSTWGVVCSKIKKKIHNGYCILTCPTITTMFIVFYCVQHVFTIFMIIDVVKHHIIHNSLILK